MRAFLLLLIIFVCPYTTFSQTNVSGVINSNTTWGKDGSPYTIVGTVQIASDDTLFIEEGVEINRNGDHIIEVFGSLIARGNNNSRITFDDIEIRQSQGGGKYVELKYVDFIYGKFLSYFVKIDISVTDSRFLSVSTFPFNLKVLSNADFIRNVFINMGPIEVSHSNESTVNIINNYFFVNRNPFGSGNIGIAYLNNVRNLKFEKNSIVSSYSPLLSLGDDRAGKFNLDENYWVLDGVELTDVLYDKNDNLYLDSEFEIKSSLDYHHIDTPSPIQYRYKIRNDSSLYDINSDKLEIEITNLNSLLSAEEHEVQISESKNFTSYNAINITDISEADIDLRFLDYETKYYLRARGVNSIDIIKSKWSDTLSFSTQVKPVDIITLISPQDGSTGLPLVLDLTWMRDPEADSYRLQLSDDSFQTWLVDSTLTDTSITTPELTYDTRYQWRVQASNQAGTGEWSEPWSFTTQVEPVDRVIPVSPMNGIDGESITPELKWYRDDNADEYTVNVTTDGFQSLVLDSTLVDTSLVSTELDYLTQYEWRVRAANQAGQGEWSDTWSFTTQVKPLAAPNPVFPPNGDGNVGVKTEFRWTEVDSAIGYHIQVANDAVFSDLAFEDKDVDSISYISDVVLESNSEFFWRVRALSSVDMRNSSWSKIFHFSTGTRTSIETDIPIEYSLSQNYPNPFNPKTTIRFSLPRPSRVRIDVYDVSGRFVGNLIDGNMTSGIHSVQFGNEQIPSGLYIYVMKTDDFTSVKKMLLLK